MKKSNHLSKILALVLSVALLLPGIPVSAETANGCAHEHDGSCGYMEGAPCGHVHDDTCGGLSLDDYADGEDSEIGDPTNAVIVAVFDELDEYTQWQGFDFGEITSQDEITLPGTLTGTDAGDNPLTIDSVTWQSNPAFDPEVSGEYLFSPALPEGYALAEGLTAPVISVFTRPEDGAQPVPLVEVTAVTADTSWYTGNELDTEYTLTTAEQLYGLAVLVNGDGTNPQSGIPFYGKTIKLDADIDFTNIDNDYNAANGNWKPIGEGSCSFQGTFDGGGHTITGISMKDLSLAGSLNSIGFFGTVVNSCVIKDLGLIDVDITAGGGVADYRIGAVVGSLTASNITVSGCYATGIITLTGQGRAAGGIAGYVYKDYGSGSTVVEGCYSAVDITADAQAQNCQIGGVAGEMDMGTVVRNCYSSGNIVSSGISANAGGITGRLTGYGATVENCYAIGRVESTCSVGESAGYVGGIVGLIDNGEIKNCAALNNAVILTGDPTSATAGRITGGYAGTLTDNIAWDGLSVTGVISESSINSGTDAVNSDSLRDGTGWPFNVSSVPWETSTAGLPILTGIPGQTDLLFPFHIVPFPEGQGDSNSPYIIREERQLYTLAERLYVDDYFAENHFLLANDLDLSAYDDSFDNPYFQGKGWLPIGYDHPFSGVFDGGGHSIDGLFFSSDSYGGGGLFSFVKDGTVKNINLTNVSIYSLSSAGGIAGDIEGAAKIENCSVSGTIEAKTLIAGGVVGNVNRGPVIENCSNVAVVTSGGYDWGNNYTVSSAGGIAGDVVGGTIRGCFNTGDITGLMGGVGGIAGVLYYSDTVDDALIEDCYSTGNVSGSWGVGGIAGEVSGTLRRSFNTGAVSATDWNTGGIAGWVGGTVENCVALNPSLSGYVWFRSSDSSYHGGRVAAYANNGTLTANSAWDGMTGMSDNTPWTWVRIGADDHDGATLTAAEIKTETPWLAFSTANGWNDYSTGKLPTLAGFAADAQTGDMPIYLADITAPALTSATPGDGSVALVWTAASPAAPSYNIYYMVSASDTPVTASEIKAAWSGPVETVSGMSYTVSGLTNGQRYYFAVEADWGVRSALSDVMSATPVSDLTDQTIAITDPVTGQTPQNTIAADTGYTGAISWNGDPATFEPSTVYTATVTLTSTAGYQWPSTPPIITVTGQTAENLAVNGTGTGNTLTFSVTFPATEASTYTATLTVNKDDTTWDSHGKNFTLKLSTNESVTETMNGTDSTVTATVGNGVWKVYDDAADTGVTITVNNATGSATLNYYTVQYSVMDADAAGGSAISANYNGSPLASGEVVLGGKTLILTATGAGATTYTYAWSGAGTNAETTSTLTINNLSAAVNATCTVTGTSTGVTVTDIVVKTQPATLTYTEGQTLDLTGLEVTLTFSDATTQDVGYADFGAYGISLDYTGAGAAMHGDRLTVAEHSGKTVTLSCNGQSAQTEALTVGASVVQHTITATAGTGGSISPSGSVTVNDDDGQTFTITPNSGYHISSVTVDDVNQGAISSYTFTNVTADHTIHVTFAANSGSSSGGGGGGTSTPSWTVSVEKKPGMPTAASISMTGTVDGNSNLSFTVTDAMTKEAVEKAQAEAKRLGKEAEGIALEIIVTATNSFKSLSANLDRTALDRLNTAGAGVSVNNSLFRFTLDDKAVKELNTQTQGIVTFSATPVSNLTGAAATAIGNRPVFDFTVKDSTGQTITSYGQGTITRGIKYTAASGEKTENLSIVKVVDGQVQWIDNSRYSDGWVIWSGDSNSVYGVGYNEGTNNGDGEELRLAGYSRIDTAIAISQKGWPEKADTVVVAYAYSFPDALAAAPLAYKENAPILLTDSQSLTASTLAEIQRLNPAKVILVGGTAVISAEVENTLRETYQVTRYAGKDSYETAAQIADALGTTGRAVVVNGEAYQDALVISSYAASQAIPILFTQRDMLPAVTAEALNKLNVGQSIVTGGTGVVSAAVYAGLPNPTRYAGYDCYETAAAVAAAVELNMNLANVYVVTGADFADALVAGNLAAYTMSPLIMVGEGSDLPSATENFFRTNQEKIQDVTIVGGTVVVAESQVNALMNILN